MGLVDLNLALNLWLEREDTVGKVDVTHSRRRCTTTFSVLIFDMFYVVLKAKGQQRPGFHDIKSRKNQNCRSDDSSSSRSCMTVELECEILFIFADVSGRKNRREQQTYHQVY